MRISRIRLSSGIMPLARGTPVRVTLTVPTALRAPGCQKLHGFIRAVSPAVAPPGLFTPRRYQAHSARSLRLRM